MRDVDQSRKDPEIDAPPRDNRSGAGSSSKAKRRGATAKQAGNQDAATITKSGEAAAWFSGAGLRRRMAFYPDQDTTAVEESSGASSPRSRASHGGRGAKPLVWATGAVGMAAAFLVVGVPLVMLGGGLGGAGVMRAAAPAGDATGISRYLRDIALLYEQTAASDAGSTPPDAPGSVGAAMAACAARAGAMPPVVLSAARAPATEATVEGQHDPLRALDLDCTSSGDAGACAAAAKSTNSYEGVSSHNSKDVAGYLAAWEAHALAAAAAAREALASSFVPSDLDSLAVDCESSPAACSAAAAATNSYEAGSTAGGGAAADREAALEAQRYLDELAAARNPGATASAAAAAAATASTTSASDADSLDSLALDCDADAEACAAAARGTNAYEGAPEHGIERARAGEEAAPATMDVSSLNIDCWGSTGDGNVDPAIAKECERSRAANSYETPAVGQGGGGRWHRGAGSARGADAGLPESGPLQGEYSWIPEDQSDGIARAVDYHASTYEEGVREAARFIGYDIEAREWDPIAAAREFQASEEGRKVAAEMRRLEAEEIAVAARRHAAGYKAAHGHAAHAGANLFGVEMVEWPKEEEDAHAEPKAEQKQQQATAEDAGKERMYYKNPCNNPSLRVSYKNPANHPLHHKARVYYKNPANAPAFIPSLPSQAFLVPAGAAPAISPLALAVASALMQPQVLVAVCIGLAGAVALALMQGRRCRAAAAAGSVSPIPEHSAPSPELAGEAVPHPLLTIERMPDLEPCQDSPRRAATGGALKAGMLSAGAPSPRRAAGPPAGLRLQEATDVDVVRSGAVDSPRRTATPALGRSATPLGGRMARGDAGAEEAE